jgi:hypothetical protein
VNDLPTVKPSGDLAADIEWFKGRLAHAAELPEYTRSQMAVVHLTDNRRFGRMPEAACFQAIYGPAGSRLFWEIECSEPVSWFRFLRLFAVTGHYDDAGQTVGDRDASQAIREMALAEAMLLAFQDGHTSLFAGDKTPLRRAKFGRQVSQDPGTLKVRVRPTAEWLVGNPKRRHLVPPSLINYLKGETANPLARNTAKTGKSPQEIRHNEIERAFLTWASGQESFPTKAEATKWAQQRGGRCTGIVRELHRQYGTRGRGHRRDA